MKRSCKWLVALVVLVAALLLMPMMLSKIGITLGRLWMGEPTSEANIKPEQFPRFKLSPSATNIGYWEDGYQFQANFNIPEEDLISSFTGLKFEEITERVSYMVWQFGDTSVEQNTRRQREWTTNGLMHREFEADGGGYFIVYDRDKSLVSIDYATH